MKHNETPAIRIQVTQRVLLGRTVTIRSGVDKVYDAVRTMYGLEKLPRQRTEDEDAKLDEAWTTVSEWLFDMSNPVFKFAESHGWSIDDDPSDVENFTYIPESTHFLEFGIQAAYISGWSPGCELLTSWPVRMDVLNHDLQSCTSYTMGQLGMIPRPRPRFMAHKNSLD